MLNYNTMAGIHKGKYGKPQNKNWVKYKGKLCGISWEDGVLYLEAC